jgi:hypothetical protein
MLNIDTQLLDKVDPDELYLLCRITNRIGANKTAWPSNRLLLQETGWHIQKLLIVKKRLEEKHLLQVTRKKGLSNRYKINTKLIKNYVGKTDEKDKPKLTADPPF